MRQVLAQAPRREVVGVTTRAARLGGSYAVTGQAAEIRRIELQRADVEGPVAVCDPLARPTAFLFGDGQDHVGGHAIA
jgi:hypothetical protein